MMDIADAIEEAHIDGSGADSEPQGAAYLVLIVIHHQLFFLFRGLYPRNTTE
jgi:hypothetical protein